MDIYVLKYNNYFNRILKKENTLFNYLLGKTLHTDFDIQTGVSFNPNDGVTATQIVNFDASKYDYLLVIEPAELPALPSINSRWFVVEATRTRSGQYNLQLQRDLLADNYDNFKNAPAFIERGMLKDDDPYIFNDEGLRYNQIKTSEFKLYDPSRCAWIVGYVPRKMEAVQDSQFDPTTSDFILKANIKTGNEQVVSEYSSWNDMRTHNLVLYNLLNQGEVIRKQSTTQYEGTEGIILNNMLLSQHSSIPDTNLYDASYFGIRFARSSNKTSYIYDKSAFNKKEGLKDSRIISSESVTAWIPSIKPVSLVRSTDLQYLGSMYYGIKTEYRLNENAYKNIINNVTGVNNTAYQTVIDTYNNKLIKVGNKYFKINYNLVNSNILNSIDNADLPQSIRDFLAVGYLRGLSNTNSVGLKTFYRYENGHLEDYRSVPGFEITSALIATMSSQFRMQLKYLCDEYSLSYTEVNKEVQTTIKKNSTRQHCYDAPYDMFCIPFKTDDEQIKMYVKEGNDLVEKILSSDAGIAIAQAMMPKLGSKNVYDIQILPYCPVTEWISNKKWLTAEYQTFTLDSNDGRVTPIKDSDDNIYSYIIWCNYTSFKGSIKQLFREKGETSVIYARYKKAWEIVNEDPKQQRCLDKYRLCSGNYASTFEFVPAMNGGITQFNYHCDYKPYQPFVKVNPEFNYLYGYDFKDANGIILSGDFSLTMLTDAWTEYKLANKNYQASFDRNIKSLDTQQEIQMQEVIFGAVSGTVQGGVQGATSGAKAGGAAGAIIGGVLGTAAGAIGSSIDINNLDRLQQDTRDNQITQFKYQLQNIQALPETIQKVTGFTQINKLVPVLEYYTCTDQEKQAFEDYLKYNAMAVGRIDTIANFEEEGGYIQGRFLRLEDLNNDYHEAYELNRTLQAGFYFNNN